VEFVFVHDIVFKEIAILNNSWNNKVVVLYHVLQVNENKHYISLSIFKGGFPFLEYSLRGQSELSKPKSLISSHPYGLLLSALFRLYIVKYRNISIKALTIIGP